LQLPTCWNNFASEVYVGSSSEGITITELSQGPSSRHQKRENGDGSPAEPFTDTFLDIIQVDEAEKSQDVEAASLAADKDDDRRVADAGKSLKDLERFSEVLNEFKSEKNPQV